MTALLTAAQMRAVEEAAIKSGEVTGLGLMERAGEGVVAAIFAAWPEFAGTGGTAGIDAARDDRPQGYLEKLESRRAVVLCGPGNNGGDGFVVARLLKGRGWDVEVFLYGDAGKLPVDAFRNYERWEVLGSIKRLSLPVPTEAEIEALEFAAGTTVGKSGPDLVVDALFGTGLARSISGLAAALEEIQIAEPANSDGWWPRVVAIDIASGICADSGKIIGGIDAIAVGAHLTVSFHARKLGHVLEDGPLYCGKLVCASIGLDANSTMTRKALAEAGGLEWPGARLGRVVVSTVEKDELHPDLLKAVGHKYSYGHALVLSGGVGKSGAARMAARGALRVGAGLVTVACPPAALQENAGRLDAIMLRSVRDGDALAEMLGDQRINALCLGPGMGIGEKAKALLRAVLEIPRSLVLDADALTLVAQDPALYEKLHDRCVLTPHGGEFARLFPDITEKLTAAATVGPAYSRADATRAAAKRAGCVVLFKGPDTVIAGPDGHCSVNVAQYERAAPWLATAGSGDVLAGIITGLLARGFGSMVAAETGAWLHVECARKFGPGLIAEDLPEQLPAVFRDLAG